MFTGLRSRFFQNWSRSAKKASTFFLTLTLVASPLSLNLSFSIPARNSAPLQDLFAPRGYESFWYNNLVSTGDRVYFSGFEHQTGWELWSSDGTPNGTRLVKDLEPGPENGLDPVSIDLRYMNGALYFIVNEREGWSSFYTSDGTQTGTVLLRRFPPQTLTSFPNPPMALTPAGDYVFFIASTGAADELWRTDGTRQGTVMLFSLEQLGGGTFLRIITSSGNLVFLTAFTEAGSPLLRSDGTPAGTFSLGMFSSPNGLVDIGGTLFFFTIENRNLSLWKTGGTPDSTVHVFSFPDDYPGGYSEQYPPKNLGVADGNLFFLTNQQDVWLWKSDGTAEGTALLTQVYYGLYAPAINDSAEFITMNGALYYSFNHWLWKSDGTPAGTQLVKDVCENIDFCLGISGLTPIDGKLYFTAETGNDAQELWKSDGTPGGTIMLKTLLLNAYDRYCFRGLCHLHMIHLVPFKNKIYFITRESNTMERFWESDGTPQGTFVVKDLPPLVFARPAKLVSTIDSLFFLTYDQYGFTLMSSDGSAQGTAPLKRFNYYELLFLPLVND